MPRAGECAVGIAEQLGLDQAVGECGAIDRDEGARASAGGVGMARQLFLAGAGLAADQDRHLAGGCAFDAPHDGEDGRVLCDEAWILAGCFR